MERIVREAAGSILFASRVQPPTRTIPAVSPGVRDTQHEVVITAIDHAGMVAEVGEVTAQYRYNISYAHGVQYNEPLSDRPFFAMKLLIDVPELGSDRLGAYKKSLEHLEPKYGFKVYGPAPDKELALFTKIDWAEDRSAIADALPGGSYF